MEQNFMIIEVIKGEYCYVQFYPTERIKDWVHDKYAKYTKHEHKQPMNNTLLLEAFTNSISLLLEAFVNSISPLAFLSDPVGKENLDLKYKLAFEDFEGQDVKDEPITFMILGDIGRSITITKDILDNTFIKTGMLADDVKKHEYRFWHNKNSCFLEVAVRGFNRDVDHPIIGLVHYGEVKSSTFMKALLGDDNG